MIDDRERRMLAARAAAIFNADPAKTYMASLEAALFERNPTDDPRVARTLLRSLLNVEVPSPSPNRLREGREDPWPDMEATREPAPPPTGDRTGSRTA